MRKLFLFALASAIIVSTHTVRADEWARTYGGSDFDWIYAIREVAVGEYITAGYTYSFGAGDSDVWVLKLDSVGDITWEKAYGQTDMDFATATQETSDGGYLVAGYTESFGAGAGDVWVLKLNSDGTINWQNAYGADNSDEAYSIYETSDNAYLVAGRTNSFGDGDSDAWVVKLNSAGTVLWQRRYGGNCYDTASCILENSEGDYIVAGETWTTVSGRTNDSDIFVMKLESNGDIFWQKSYGGIDSDTATCIQQTSDGGYILVADTRSFGGISNIWVLKLTSIGTITWQKTYGGTWSFSSSIQETSDGDYIVAGHTYSFGAGFFDSWVLELDGQTGFEGDILWQKTYGGSDFDLTYSIQETTGGNYLMAGSTDSSGAGYYDSWVLEVDSAGDIPDCSIIDTSTATASDTTITAEDSYLTVTVTTGTTTNTSALIQDTSAVMAILCPLTGPDTDNDGMPDMIDNCPLTPNGPDLGTCAKTIGIIEKGTGVTCNTVLDCGGGESCQKNQEDCNDNTIGDACECYADFNGDGFVYPSDLSVFLSEYGRTDCTSNPPCQADIDGDGNVYPSDLSVFLDEYGKEDCPTIP